MPRLYTVSFEQVAVVAPQDLLQINGAAGKMLRIKRTALSSTDTTIPTSQMIALRARFLPATVTNGSVGTAPTPARTDPGDAAPSFTAYANNTTKATSSGTPVVLFEGGCHVYNGYDATFEEDGRGAASPAIGPGEAWVFELLSTVSGTVHLSGTVWVEEVGG